MRPSQEPVRAKRRRARRRCQGMAQSLDRQFGDVSPSTGGLGAPRSLAEAIDQGHIQSGDSGGLALWHTACTARANCTSMIGLEGRIGSWPLWGATICGGHTG